MFGQLYSITVFQSIVDFRRSLRYNDIQQQKYFPQDFPKVNKY